MNTRTARLLGMMSVWAVMCGVAEASLVTKNDTIDDIMLRYRIPCDGSVSTINLGDVAISLADAGAYTNMSATLTIDASAQNHCLFSCMELHWLQTIWHLSATDPANR